MFAGNRPQMLAGHREMHPSDPRFSPSIPSSSEDVRLRARFCVFHTSDSSAFSHHSIIRITKLSSALSPSAIRTGTRVAVMDRRMFDQLDQLERGARDVQPRNDSHAYGRNNSSQYHNDDVYNRQPQQYHQNEATTSRQIGPFVGERG